MATTTDPTTRLGAAVTVVGIPGTVVGAGTAMRGGVAVPRILVRVAGGMVQISGNALYGVSPA